MSDALAGLMATVARYWGFQTLRPLQERAVQAVLARRDSLVVMPTGGGKSLCYQAPAVFRGGASVVVSPLIALMKDQVDALRRIGVNAVRFDSTQSATERAEAEKAVRSGTTPLVFVSPERLAMPGFPTFLGSASRVQAVAVDEAHCISHWGHDFRPEYRQLRQLRKHFPGASIHGYTATATSKVRADIVEQLGLTDPDILVGSFDRPNLTYRVLPRLDLVKQVCEVIKRHPKDAGIVYCLRRKDVEELAEALSRLGFDAFPYHAGMDHEARRKAQERFTRDDAPVVCATVAFGMGIDRPDVRFVIHGAMPKSVEHYQQETGRAGRDGDPAECVLFFSGSDAITLRQMVEKSADEAGGDRSHLDAVYDQLATMDRYCRGATCRHRALVRHFEQEYETPNCGACDVCLGDTKEVPDAQIVAQKILSCIARVKEGFGATHVIGVLRGENTEAIRSRGHEKLSTYGLLKGVPKADLRDWVFQLVGQEVLVSAGSEYPVLKLNAASWAVMKGEQKVRLIQLARTEVGAGRKPAATPGTSAADMELFEVLRQLRREIATAEQVPAYRVFPDSVLSAMANIRPTTLEELLQITGVGEVKLKAYGAKFLDAVKAFNVENPPTPTRTPAGPRASTAPAAVAVRKREAFELFRDGCVIADVMHQLGIARSTACDYLCQFLEAEPAADVTTWVPAETIARVRAAVAEHGTEKLKPIFAALNEEITYDEIRIVLTRQRVAGANESTG